MTCTNGTCEYDPPIQHRQIHLTKDQIRYGTLWAEIELPKLLNQRRSPAPYNEPKQAQPTSTQLEHATYSQKCLSNKNRTNKTMDKQEIGREPSKRSDNSINEAPVSILYSPQPLRTTSHPPPRAHALPKQKQVFPTLSKPTVETKKGINHLTSHTIHKP